jgi:hypothetical protein
MPGEVTSGLFVLAGAILVYVANGFGAWCRQRIDQKKVMREKYEELCINVAQTFATAQLGLGGQRAGRATCRPNGCCPQYPGCRSTLGR